MVSCCMRFRNTSQMKKLSYEVTLKICTLVRVYFFWELVDTKHIVPKLPRNLPCCFIGTRECMSKFGEVVSNQKDIHQTLFTIFCWPEIYAHQLYQGWALDVLQRGTSSKFWCLCKDTPLTAFHIFPVVLFHIRPIKTLSSKWKSAVLPLMACEIMLSWLPGIMYWNLFFLDKGSFVTLYSTSHYLFLFSMDVSV